MKTPTVVIVIVIVAALFAIFVFGTMGKKESNPITNILTKPGTMEIKSSAFEQNANIPKKFTCDGEDINPSLSWSGIPEGTQSLALIMDDPDAPVGLFVHWLVWNIKPAVTEINEHSVPEGAMQGTTSFGQQKYGGPCPPDGEHRYFFKLYALDAELNIPEDSGKEELEEAMVGHVLDSAELVGRYTRQ